MKIHYNTKENERRKKMTINYHQITKYNELLTERLDWVYIFIRQIGLLNLKHNFIGTKCQKFLRPNCQSFYTPQSDILLIFCLNDQSNTVLHWMKFNQIKAKQIFLKATQWYFFHNKSFAINQSKIIIQKGENINQLISIVIVLIKYKLIESCKLIHNVSIYETRRCFSSNLKGKTHKLNFYTHLIDNSIGTV